MYVHTVFVEPANYTADLIQNIHQKRGYSYSFIKSSSLASNQDFNLTSTIHIFQHKKFLSNLIYVYQRACKNKLIIVNGYNHYVFLLFWFCSFITKSNIGIESDTPFKKIKGFKGFVKQLYLKILFKNKLVLGLSGGSNLHKKLFIYYGLEDKRIFLLPMMVNNQKYFRKKILEYSTGKKNLIKILYVGRLVEVKNITLLIKAFNNIQDSWEEVQLYIVGDGPLKQILELKAKEVPNIKFLGNLFENDLVNVYHECDLFVLPSSFEPWGLVINEALSAGLAVVCSSNVGAVHDLVTDPDAGWVFPNNDDQALTKLLVDIISNPVELQRKALNGYLYMKNYWNYELYGKCLDSVIKYVEEN